MKYCDGCGSPLNDGDAVCPACGKAVGAANTNAGGGFDFNKAVNDFNNTKDTTADYDAADISASKAICMAAYVPILFFVPLVAAQQSKFGKYHANQGLIFTIASVGGMVALRILRIIFSLIFLGFLADILTGVFVLAILAYMTIGIVNAGNGRAKELPIIGKINLINN